MAFDPPSMHPASAGRQRLMILAAVGLLVAAAAFLFWRARPALAPGVAPRVADAAAAHPSPAATPSGASERPATPAEARALFDGLSPRPELRDWVRQVNDPVAAWAIALGDLAMGEDPRKQLRPLAPKETFEVDEIAGRFTEAQAATHRFDLAAAVVASIDARAAAAAFRHLHGQLDAIYRSIGPRGVSLDEAAARAMKRIEDAPAPATPPALERSGRRWAFSDPQLEKLGPVEKQMLRLGHDNELKLQAKARELREALQAR